MLGSGIARKAAALSILMCLWAALGAAPTGPAPSTAPGEIDWSSIVQRLGSDDFKEREAAQRDLGRATWRHLDKLRQLAEAATDLEAKSRLQKRIDEINEQIAVDPPPISLEIKDASFDDMVNALGKATGVTLTAWPPGMARNRMGAGTYTLAVTDEPFWQVFGKISRQHGIQLQGWDAWRIMQQDPGLRTPQIFGGLAVFPQSLTRSTTVDLQKEPGEQVQPQTMSFQYLVALDPRIKMASFEQPQLVQVTDDAGNVLHNEQPAQNPNFWNPNMQNGIWNCSTTLTIPEKMGRKIASAKGQARILVQQAEDKVVVTDVEKKLGQPLTVAGQSVTINKFALQGNSVITFDMICIPNLGAVRLPGIIGNDQPPSMRMTFIDANGQRIWTGVLQGGHSGSVGGNNIVGPVKIEFVIPTKTKPMTLPFELKDLPLP